MGFPRDWLGSIFGFLLIVPTLEAASKIREAVNNQVLPIFS